jgi:hypothetical protein
MLLLRKAAYARQARSQAAQATCAYSPAIDSISREDNPPAMKSCNFQ